MAIEGSNILLIVDVGTSSDPDWQAVAKQTSLDTSNERNIIDASYKQKDHENSIYGKQSGTLTLESLEVKDGTNSPAMDAIEDAVKNSELVVLRRQENSDHVKEVEGKVENISKEYPDDDASTISVDFQKFGPWVVLSDTDDEAEKLTFSFSPKTASETVT